MSIALLLIPLGLLLLAVAVWAFFWAVNNGQFDDLDHVAEHALEDESPAAALPKSPP
ncbi:MAG: cbb3-type cytochrome oxidase assembly protein CcoS [Gammaproteobacteria bacterium]|nr:cbb3-type cytochrome oxidase assembly protein CcoS [Gammaproteobacteria bacterium]MDE2251780.1 cbb3-type cytochrome oxidase assembly protein CcoS [Gammaproteobacteria bacterium]